MEFIKQEFRGNNLSKGIPREWLLDEFDKFLMLIKRFFTREGRFDRFLQYHLRLLLHFTSKKELDIPFYLFLSIQKMIKKAQEHPQQLEKHIFRYGLIKLLIVEELKKKSRDWNTFLFVANYQVEMPSSTIKSRSPKKKKDVSPVMSKEDKGKQPMEKPEVEVVEATKLSERVKGSMKKKLAMEQEHPTDLQT